MGWQLENADFRGIVWDVCASDAGIICATAADALLVSSTAVKVQQLYEVTDYGQILAIIECGTVNGSTHGLYAGYLVLYGDFTDDFVVDTADLSVLLGAWGTVSATFQIGSDLDGTGAVDAADLSLLLGAYTSGQLPVQLPCSGPCCLPDISPSEPMANFGDVLAMFGFENAAAFVAWVHGSETGAINEMCGNICFYLHNTGE